ncbi:MAG: hypothetical protein ACOC22_00445 [bacterium]
MNNRASYDPQEYMNLISLLQQALKFYAKDENYVQKIVGRDNELCSAVELDDGAQAKFALDKIKEFDIRYDEDDEFSNKLKDVMDTQNETDILKIIEQFKNFK